MYKMYEEEQGLVYTKKRSGFTKRLPNEKAREGYELFTSDTCQHMFTLILKLIKEHS